VLTDQARILVMVRRRRLPRCRMVRMPMRVPGGLMWVMIDVMLAAMRMRVALPHLDRIRIRRRTAVSERMECIRGNGHKPVAEQNAQDNQMPDQIAHQEIAASGIAFASDRFFRRFLRASS
jgi:hypothetical protein